MLFAEVGFGGETLDLGQRVGVSCMALFRKEVQLWVSDAGTRLDVDSVSMVDGLVDGLVYCVLCIAVG
jgi:hypothetical protein